MNTDPNQLDALRYFAEEAGLLFEQMSMPRMAGRVVGWLLVCNPPHQSMAELVNALQTSKASISTTTRLLMEMNFIERIHLPGYRYDHYRLKAGVWDGMTRNRLAQVSTVKALAERGLLLVKNDLPSAQNRLQEMCDVYAFWEQEIPGLISRWETAKATPKNK